MGSRLRQRKVDADMMTTTSTTNTKTIEINGKQFTVAFDASKDNGRYTLTKIGGRGLTYETWRIKRQPYIMFLVNPNASGPSAVTKIYLTDEGGELRQVNVA